MTNQQWRNVIQLPVSPDFNIFAVQQAIVSTDSDCCAFAPNIFGKLPKNTISRNHKITNERPLFVCERTSCRMCHHEVKSAKVLWLQARKALWSDCKQMQPSEFSTIRNVICSSTCFTCCAAKKKHRKCFAVACICIDNENGAIETTQLYQYE